MDKLQYYKLEQRDNFDMKKTRTVYKLKRKGNIDGDEFIQKVAHRRGFSDSVIKGVLNDVAKELALQLAEGFSVTLPDIGSFSLGVRLEQHRKEQWEKEQSAAEAAEESGATVSKIAEPNAQKIVLHHINFRTNKTFFNEVQIRYNKKKLQRIGKAQGVRITIDDMKQSQRIAAAKAYLKEHHYMHVADYANLTGLSRSSAQRELCELDEYRFSGIMAQGLGSHRVYVLRPSES